MGLLFDHPTKFLFKRDKLFEERDAWMRALAGEGAATAIAGR
jgi:hypothetical protein